MVNHPKAKQLFTNISIIVSTLLLMVLTTHTVAAAGNASFALSPASGSYKVGDNVTVKITENSGTEAVNAVEADLVYDKAVLQFVSIDAGASAFAIAAPTTAGGGVVNIPRGSMTALTGTQTVASVTFKVIGTGTTAIRFAGTSGIIKESGTVDIWNRSTAGATFTAASVTTPTPTPTTPTPTPTQTSPTKTPTTSTPSGTTSSPSTSTPAIAPPATTAPGAPATAVVSEAPADAVVTQPSQLIDERLVAIKVLDEDNKPVVGATVVIDGKEVKTDSQGIASFVGIADGKRTVKISHSGKTIEENIDVKDGENGSSENGVQAFNVKLASDDGQFSVVSPLIYAGLAAVIVISLWLIMMPHGHRLVVNGDVAPPEGIVISSSDNPTPVYRPEVQSSPEVHTTPALPITPSVAPPPSVNPAPTAPPTVSAPTQPAVSDPDEPVIIKPSEPPKA
jgi:Cohesin domain